MGHLWVFGGSKSSLEVTLCFDYSRQYYVVNIIRLSNNENDLLVAVERDT